MLAIVEAVGSPDPTRSHFDAQDYMESGTPGLKRDGWLNRALTQSGSDTSPLRAVAMGASLPRTLRGEQAAIAVLNDHALTYNEPFKIDITKFDGNTWRPFGEVISGSGS